MTPRGEAIFGPRGDYLNKLGRGPLGDATYQGQGLMVSDKKIFSWFSLYKSMLKWPQGHNLNKLGRGLLGDTIYQISRL